MSRGWASGSSRAYRALRRFVLDRDGWRCRMLGEDGQVCGIALSPWPGRPDSATLQHLDALADGHPKICDPERAVAACRTHNLREAAQITNAKRAAQAANHERGWEW